VADKLVYGAHQLMIHEMSEATMVPLLAIPADDALVLAGTAARRSGSTPISRSKLCKKKRWSRL
jgi:hypothetical protein